MFCYSGYSTEGSGNPSEVPRERNDANKVVVTLPDGRIHSVNMERDLAHWIPDLVKEFTKVCYESRTWDREDLATTTGRCRKRSTVCFGSPMQAIDAFAAPCRGLKCRDCATYKAQKLLAHFVTILARLYADGKRTWFAEVAVQDCAMVSVVRARFRKRANERSASYLTACRGRTLAILATAPLEGRDEPTSMRELTLPEAVNVLLRFLQVPVLPPGQSLRGANSGFRPFSQSDDWTPPQIWGRRGNWERIAMASSKHIPRQVAEDMGYVLGNMIRPRDGMSIQGFVKEFRNRVSQENSKIE